MRPFTLNIRQSIERFDAPLVMAILNVTPDSFYNKSRFISLDQAEQRIERIVSEGADIIDVGGCSTRPGFEFISPEEEIDRICPVLEMIKKIAPEVMISVDTFYSKTARYAVSEMGCDIINDISSGLYDPAMFDTVADLNVPYILTHNRLSKDNTKYKNVTSDVLYELSIKTKELTLKGVKDIIIDPGFGFSKTTDQNFSLMSDLSAFETLNRPILVGISRKSMITKTLKISTEDSLNATTALNLYSLIRGASILRVHDVEATSQIIKLYRNLNVTQS